MAPLLFTPSTLVVDATTEMLPSPGRPLDTSGPTRLGGGLFRRALPVDDTNAFSFLATLETGMQFCDHAIQEGGAILVHCRAGLVV